MVNEERILTDLLHYYLSAKGEKKVTGTPKKRQSNESDAVASSAPKVPKIAVEKANVVPKAPAVSKAGPKKVMVCYNYTNFLLS